MHMACYMWLSVLAVVNLVAGGPPNRILHNGEEMFLSGINVAWGPVSFGNDISYLDPTCKSDKCIEDQTYFIEMMKDIQSHSGNSIRFWLHPDGNPLPVINDDYSSRLVAPMPDSHLRSLHFVLQTAQRFNIVVNLCLWSFDMVNDMGYGDQYGLWNKILTNDTNTLSYVANWLTPVVEGVQGYSSLLSLEVFNEPEGMTNTWGWTQCTSNTSDCARVDVITLQKASTPMYIVLCNLK